MPVQSFPTAKKQNMAIELYHVDAFCKDLFSGNPAAICPLDAWLDDHLMQNIAAENNLAETAFFVPEKKHFHIRWFTPSVEVDLCGHATLAAAHVLFTHKNYPNDKIVFTSRSGELPVTKKAGCITLDFPVDTIKPVEITDNMCTWFNQRPLEAYKGRADYLLIFPAEADIANIKENIPVIEKLTEARGVIISAHGATAAAAAPTAAAPTADFVSRFFAPQSGIPEDPVTGSAHTTLTPYWSAKLKKKKLIAIQLSPRRGYLECEDKGERIEISGIAKTFSSGHIFI
jgi:PhzF family phenazine biosynthesis protein